MSILANVVDVFVDDKGQHGNPLGILWASSSTRKQEQQIAADLGFSETIFIDGVDGVATARIFTPTQELPFAGHPTVGLAAWLRSNGDEVKAIHVPAGSVRVRFDGERTFVTAMPEWTPAFEFQQLDSAHELRAVDPDAFAQGLHYLWAWIDEDQHRVRARMFAPDLGIREDEATGAAAVRLSAELGRDLQIVQGQGSLLHTHVRYLGQQIEVGGNVSDARTLELR
ncbi:PhzF family phenazine biosynthesis protein [Microbacterium pygmaeum]|uniref:Phenazine biosynthesis protein PhzF family n=1 Tax=Microbacterium pygmaeum TaxID=370764 RepID=A0A1G7TW68_9MICO|nr:PhzF family phenazine biosynthesis protein [Microbacterium pygmaeum]SDG39284.1 phenazine biosynthesis protein PhzF family [Microbacterium pygmaeum]